MTTSGTSSLAQIGHFLQHECHQNDRPLQSHMVIHTPMTQPLYRLEIVSKTGSAITRRARLFDHCESGKNSIWIGNLIFHATFPTRTQSKLELWLAKSHMTLRPDIRQTWKQWSTTVTTVFCGRVITQ